MCIQKDSAERCSKQFRNRNKTNAKAKRINRVWVTYAQLEGSAGHICHTLQLHSPFKRTVRVCITYLTQIRNSFFSFLLFHFYFYFISCCFPQFKFTCTIWNCIERTICPTEKKNTTTTNYWFKRKDINRNQTHRKSMKHVKIETFLLCVFLDVFSLLE